MSDNKVHRKFIHLEFARGVASFIVMFSHFCVAFLPVMKMPLRHGGLQFTPFYFVINGYGAVDFFFIMSGFVLTQGFFQKPTTSGLAASVIKRLPRLLVPTSVTIFAGFLILKYSSWPFESAAAMGGSGWLRGFGGGAKSLTRNS